MTDEFERFHDLLEQLQRERVWVDEKYALPIDLQLLDRFIRGQTPQVTAEFVEAQITGFQSWRDAFLQQLSNVSKEMFEDQDLDSSRRSD